MRFFLLFAFLASVVGCSTKRQITITTVPPDATLNIDGLPAGQAPHTREFVFRGGDDVHRVTASRLGYKDQSVELHRDDPSSRVNIELKPQTRKISVIVQPGPAIIKANGKPLSTEPTGSVTTELPFTVDAQDNWTSYTVTAERKGFVTAERKITFTDPDPFYRFNLEPVRKDVLITTEPTGAQVSVDEQPLGKSPIELKGRVFSVDPNTNEFIPQTVRVVSPGYDPIEANISWDNGQSTYHIDLKPKTKTVKIVTQPAGSVVTLDGKELQRDQDGASMAVLTFPPINETGELKTYTGVATRKTENSEWYPQTFTIAWEDGRPDYRIELKEILTVPVRLVIPEMQRNDDGWRIVPREVATLGMKDVKEDTTQAPPVKLTRLQKDSIIDTITVSPDGQQVLYTLLIDVTSNSLRSLMVMIRSDGTGGETYMNDGKSLELTPLFTPGGEKILFSSNRGGRRMSIWAMSTTGEAGIEQYTTGETSDIWPTIDSDPRPRLFYQAHVETRPDPRLYMTTLGTSIRTDLTRGPGGQQPRVSPKNDAIVFAGLNEKTGKRDIFKMSDRGGVPENITNTPDIDEIDPMWNRDGSRIAFASDRARHDETGNNYDVWYMDLNRTDRPVQVTSNGSRDDCPVWDPQDNAIYFRSNRGGEWGVWKIPLR